jgi:hypothetical protein
MAYGEGKMRSAEEGSRDAMGSDAPVLLDEAELLTETLVDLVLATWKAPEALMW